MKEIWFNFISSSTAFLSFPLFTFILTLSLYLLFKFFLKKEEFILWPIAKLLSLLLFASSMQLLALTQFLTLSFSLGIFVLLVFSLLSFYFVLYRKERKLSILKNLKGLNIDFKAIFFLELIFLLVYFVFALYSSFHPELINGEKALDMSFLSYFTEVQNYPFTDPWAYGFELKYYYFGYFIFGLLSRMTFLSPTVSYVLAISILPALFFQIVVSLMTILKVSKKLAVLMSLFLVFSANLKSLVNIFLNTQEHFLRFWSATRIFINGNFAEFPSWSFIFMDLHAHVMTYPFALLSLTLVLLFIQDKRSKEKSMELLLEEDNEISKKQRDTKFLVYYFLVPFSLASLLILNAWDFIIYVPLSTLLIIYLLKSPIRSLCIFFVTGLLFSVLPFFVLQNATDIRLNIRNDFLREWEGYFYHLGIFIILILPSLAFFFYDLFQAAKEKTAYKKSDRFLVLFFLILFIYVFFLVLFSNSIHFMDHFNTIFKFNNQTYIFMGILSSLATIYLFKRKRKCFYFFGLPIMISSVVATTFNAYDFLMASPKVDYRPSFKSDLFLKDKFSEIYEGIEFVRGHIESKETCILELGSEVFDYSVNLISTFSGMPSYLARTGEALRLRGIFWEEMDRRKLIVDKIYRSQNGRSTHALLQQEAIKYVFVGLRERAKFNTVSFLKFKEKKYFKRIFLSQNKKASIYEVLDL